MATLSDLSGYSDLMSMSVLVGSIGMAGATIPAAITAIRSNTKRSKFLVYLCMVMAVTYIACNVNWSNGGLIDATGRFEHVRYSLWSLLPFVLANGYLIEFARCRKCLNLTRRINRVKKTEIRVLEAR